MSEESQNPSISPELEARIVALVLGEVSDFEREELNRLIEQRPELVTLKRCFEEVHGLLCEIGTDAFAAPGEDWKLSADRRHELLAVMGECADEPMLKPTIVSMDEKPWGQGYSWLQNLTKIAAVLCVAGFIGMMTMSGFVFERLAIDATSTGGTSRKYLYENAPVASLEEKHDADSDANSDYAPKAMPSLAEIREGVAPQRTALDAYLKYDGEPDIPAVPQSDLSSDTAAQSEVRLGERLNREMGDKSAGTNPSDSDVKVQDLEQNVAGVPDRAAFALDWDTSSAGRFFLGGSAPQDGTRPESSMEPTQSLNSDLGLRVGDSVGKDPHGPIGGRASYGDISGSAGMIGGGSGGGIGGPGIATNDATIRGRYLAPNFSFSFGANGQRDGVESQPDVSWGRQSNETQVQGVPNGVPPTASTGHFAKELAGSPEVGKQLSELAVPSSGGEELVKQAVNGPGTDDLAMIKGRPLEGMAAVPSAEAGTIVGLKFLPQEKAIAPAGLNENNAADQAFSTFSLHVSDVSFKLAHAALTSGEWPEAAKVRIEEFVNAFDYGDPMPGQGQEVACRIEQSVHPFLQQRNLMRVSMRTAAGGRASNTPLRLTLLLDNSGSMERFDRQLTVRRAFAMLAQQLKPIDQVTLISFARQPRLLADQVSGSQAQQLVQLINELPSEGGTHIEAALQLAFEKAKEQQLEGAQNRIVLLTDGAVNLGDANPESLSQRIAVMRDAGIAFDAAGINAEGLNDEILEALTRKGDGRYYLLDSLEAADEGFARQIAGALRPSAKNVKVQVEFNPKRVGRYKLLGFEQHLLKQEEFRNDRVDAAEMSAAEAGVAMYQFEAKPDGEGDVGSVTVRFQDLSSGQMVEKRWPIPYQADVPRPERAAPSLRIAISAAMLAAKFRGEPLGEAVDLKTLSDLIAGLPDRDRNSQRVSQLQWMIQQARQLSGK